MFCVNMLSAWSCSRWAETLVADGALASGDESLRGGIECLQGECYYDNVFWACMACLTAVWGSAAAVFRSPQLARLLAVLHLARALFCAKAVFQALTSPAACAYWALSTAYWAPAITLANAFCHGALALRFARVLEAAEVGPVVLSQGGGTLSKQQHREMTEMEGIEDLLEDFELED